MKNVKKNDEVKILTGKDKGKTGKILAVVGNEKVVVEKINIVKRHTKRNQQFQGGIVEKPSPVDISNVSLICPSCKQTTRVSKQKEVDGKNVRSCKKCGEIIDKA